MRNGMAVKSLELLVFEKKIYSMTFQNAKSSVCPFLYGLSISFSEFLSVSHSDSLGEQKRSFWHLPMLLALGSAATLLKFVGKSVLA